ncbi:C2H2 finger domain protein, putative [Talaromyces stipitatus ATCC 10500]|uniref:C2H2 finger domain protein, putative n=1 Tax=Talaromyces stipitatus (strain ATCC 10500 / CBS 375.48 / QM 6759 / NRRL 1006) TaxID=441959 RepID=B8LUJ5_TALSN|nr:C2H2 finger domain protein, putative [Talaromyces stipitatus ATCC 10500]EED23768.1 C2H2 finger domain protein, putative [Talaromyces stipitatus ATCC 10500]
MDFSRFSPHEENPPTQSYSSRGPMRIPTKTIEDFAPPPLPPPQRINDLENGHDAGWLHANGMGRPDMTKLAPINPSSSLFGGHRAPEPIPRIERMSLDDSAGRSSSFSHTKIELPRRETSSFQSSYATHFSEPILQGEQNFSRKCVMSSSDNYDRHLLSKIGKPHSPPRTSSILGNDFRSGSLGTSFQPSSLYDSSYSLGNYAVSPGGLSPRSKASWKDTSDYRSPSVESNAPSTSIDYDSRRRTGALTPQSEDTFSFFPRPGRPYQEQSVFPDVECEDDNHMSHSDYLSGQHGMKRRASSPPREPILHKAPSNGDLASRRTSAHHFTNHVSPTSRHLPSHNSISSLSSASWRTSTSFSSSAGLSAGTSASSYDRMSTGGQSPKSDGDHYHDKAVVNQPSPNGSVGGFSTLKTPYYNGDSKPTVSNRKISFQSGISGPRGGNSKLGGLYICDCCPKKPKKFETQEELRTHELEKQYTCQYCSNRFKNKNEAERHQNSLHLRRHSWSCAALANFQAAFHPSTSPVTQTSAGPTHDTCGYCGEEFPNNPEPDWDQRFEHLTTMHKFGECNNVKKFFRADHFRQHLKHSHAGTPGKWTNILENACMKEEPQAESRLGSISEKGCKRSELGDAPLTSSTIDEVMDES